MTILRYLAHGVSRYVYALKFKMATSTIGRIICETSEILWNQLNGIYLSPPNESDWLNIANEYERRWNLPHCIGAIDGKHVSIVCPPKAGSQYFNYKGRHSIALLAVCDANYCFTMVDIGAFGSQSDGGIFAESSFGKLLNQKKVPLPPPSALPNCNESFQFYFIGDSAFPLGNNLMRSFPGQNLSKEEENFNKHIFHSRVTIENTFGILSARWRVLRSDIHALPKNVDKIVKSTVLLQNYVMLNKCASYCPEDYIHSSSDDNILPGQWRNDLDEIGLRSISSSRAHNGSRVAYEDRKRLARLIYN